MHPDLRAQLVYRAFGVGADFVVALRDDRDAGDLAEQSWASSSISAAVTSRPANSPKLTQSSSAGGSGANTKRGSCLGVFR
jgi:hypothetical protein